MSNLHTLRGLLNTQSTTQTGVVSDVSRGVITVLLGSKQVVCTSGVPVSPKDRVRVQGQVILSKINPAERDIPVFRV